MVVLSFLPGIMDYHFIFVLNIILDKGKMYFTSSFCVLSLFIAVMLLALVGFTNPVLGNIVRYRMIAMLV